MQKKLINLGLDYGIDLTASTFKAEFSVVMHHPSK